MRERMAEAHTSTQMETDEHQKSAPPPIDEYEFRRPSFVNAKLLKEKYPCAICKDILVKPQQTAPCGCRVCLRCIEALFAGKDLIKPCPLEHEDLDEDEIEECQTLGLSRQHITQDHSVYNSLMREKVFCRNQPYGCCDKVPWKKLKDHELQCTFNPSPCPNKNCPELFAATNMAAHQERCLYALTECSYCRQQFARKEIEIHISECDFAETQCVGCGKNFAKRKVLIAHQQINADCLTKPGRCFYYDYCGFETGSVKKLQQHLKESSAIHLEALTLKTHETEQYSTKASDASATEVKKAVNKKVKPLERITAELSMKVTKLGNQLESSETNGDHLVNAMRTVNTNSQEIETVKSRVAQIERQIKDAGLDRVTVIESHSQTIRRHNELLNEMEKRVRNLEVTSYDGTLIWKIKDYKRRKNDAVRGRQMSIYSHPFYTSRNGYKMCLRAYLNGDGLGRGKCLSLFFVVMRGEYDELLQFPFKQRVTFTLLSPKSPELGKHETFLPDPDSSSFRRPQTEMNIASGCPQFALHSEVESSTFLVNDAIYIRAKVEQGGDTIP